MTATTQRLRIDPVACDGIGQCALAAPDLVRLDRWGYPVLPGELAEGSARAASRAVASCPRQALWLEPGTPDAPARRAP